IRDQTGFVLGLNFDCLIFIAFHDAGFVEARGVVRDRYGHTRPGAPVEASVFEVVQRTSGIYQWVAFSKIVDQFAKGALGCNNFYPWVVSWQQSVEQHATDGGFQVHALTWFPTFWSRLHVGWYKAVHTDGDGCAQVSLTGVRTHDGFTERGVGVANTNDVVTNIGQDRKSTRLNSSHVSISNAAYC